MAINNVARKLNEIAHQAEMQRCIVELDVEAAERLWRHIAPHMPQPKTKHDTLATLHVCRTANERAVFKLRAYSHAWLVERDLPSQLPDQMKPRAERLYPRVVTAAGYSVNFRSPYLRMIRPIVMKAIGDRMEELWADNKNKAPDSQLVLKEICDTKNAVMRKLVGKISGDIDAKNPD